MKRILFIAVAFAIAGLFLADVSYAHGGSFRGPNGGVPPGLREPSDPEPPPPPPSDPGTPGAPTTPGEPAPPGPTTPGDQGQDTPSDGPPPPGPLGPADPAGGRGPTSKSLTFESWRFWWGYNNDDILNLKSHIYSTKTSSSSPIFFSSKKDEENRRNAQRPTERAVIKTIIPALMRSLNRPDDHEDIHGGSLVALGKIGTAQYVPLFRDAMYKEWVNEKGTKMDFGLQATESATLALGLLPDLDEKGKEAVRKVCLEAIANDSLRTRERTWAAVALGLQQDTAAVQPLWALLSKNYPGPDVPAGILAGLGLIGDGTVPVTEGGKTLREELEAGFESPDGKFMGQDVNESVRAFMGYAIGKIGSHESLVSLNKILKSRRYGRIIKRSAAIAAGVCGANPNVSAEMQTTTINTLVNYIRKSGGDPSGENFAIVALSQIGSEKALDALLDIAENGKYGQRPFAGLGLGTYVWYKERNAEYKQGEGVDPDMRAKIVDKLIKLSDKYKDVDTKAAFMLARGLVKDRTALEEMVALAAKKSGDPVLRGFCCVGLGLIGEANDEVKAAMKLALDERKSVDLRRDAATGLSLLKDAEVVKLLLEELRTAKSFAEQGQLITAIGTIGDHTAIDPLVEILDSKSAQPMTRAMAAVGLGMIGDLRAIPALSRLSKNYNYRASVPDLDELLFIL